jgi:hypothetical protein
MLLTIPIPENQETPFCLVSSLDLGNHVETTILMCCRFCAAKPTRIL